MTVDIPTTGDTPATSAPRTSPPRASLAQLLATEHRHTTRCWWDPTRCRWNCAADRGPHTRPWDPRSLTSPSPLNRSATGE